MGVRFWVRRILHRRDSIGAGKVVLLPLALLGKAYGSLMTTRRALYRSGFFPSVHAGVPTVCVGNVTVGGTGKTPLVAEICRILQELGARPAVLTRGYRGRLRGRIAAVSDGTRVLLDPATAGDEPVLLAERLRNVPVMAGADRRLSSAEAIRRFGVNVLVMDDGFQHLRLRRDLNIVVVDATRPFGNTHCLPRGTLREPLAALADAHLFVLSRTDLVDAERKVRLKEELAALNPSAPIIETVHAPDVMRDPATGELRETAWLRGRKVVGFAGIGNPEAFFGELSRLGATVVETVAFPDHHPYSAADVARLAKWAGLTNAEALVTTEKDGMRLRPFLPLPVPVWTVGIQMDLGAGEAVLRRELAALLKAHAESPAG